MNFQFFMFWNNVCFQMSDLWNGFQWPTYLLEKIHKCLVVNDWVLPSVQCQIHPWASNTPSKVISLSLSHQTEIGSIFLQHKVLDFSFHCCLSIWLHTIFPSDLFHHSLDQQTSQVVFKILTAFLWEKVNFSTSF